MTDFVINLAESHLKNLSKSLIDNGRPRGLMALILVAVRMYLLWLLWLLCITFLTHYYQLERAACAFKSGEFVKPGIFNNEHNALLTEYLKSIDKFNHWDEFHEACGISLKAKSPKRRKSAVADLSLVEIGRGDLNFSSSPVRE